MCIIAAKPAGVPMPSRDTIRTMWNNNQDGAGIMYLSKGQVKIEKGFMKLKDFSRALDRLEKDYDLTSTPVVMHFRITTHGGTSPENTHPFPITDSIGALKKLIITTDIGVAHNGIIHIKPRKNISDTMEYIASQLAPLKRMNSKFYENKHALALVENAIQSKMAFLSRDGKITTVGEFIEHDGVLYSNSTFEKLRNLYRGSCYSWYDEEYGYWYTSTKAPTDAKEVTSTPKVVTVVPEDEYDGAYLMPMEEGTIVQFTDGTMDEGYEYFLDEQERVYGYDWEGDCAYEIAGARAYTENLAPVRFDETRAEYLNVCPF